MIFRAQIRLLTSAATFFKYQRIFLILALFVAVTLETQAQHFHLNVGALSQAQDSPLFFQGEPNFINNSGFVLPMSYATNGSYAGYYFTASLSPTAIFAGFFDDPAPGAQLRLRFVGVSGPPGGSFGVWDSDGSGPATALTFEIPAGTTNGTNSILLSENNGEPGADPGGHIHGRAFSATKPGLYAVTVQAYDNSANVTGGGPIHTPSILLPVYFQAGITIVGFTRETNQVAITFASRSGSSYYVQSTSNLADTNSWQDIAGPFTGNFLQGVTNSNVSNSARFYRLRVTTP